MKKKKNILLILCLVLCLVYLKSRTTYTAYRNQIEGNFALPISKWEIKVDKKSINTAQQNEITISDVEWDSTHTREGKAALGSKGNINVEIDPTDTGVAIKYRFKIIDKSKDPEKILTLNSVSSDNSEIIKTGVNEYTGIISLDDIKNKRKPLIKFSVEWKDEGDYFFDPDDTNTDNFILLDFTASQYRGEDLYDNAINLNISMVNKFTWAEPYYAVLLYSNSASTVRKILGTGTLNNWTYLKIENGVVTNIDRSTNPKGDLVVPALGANDNNYIIITYENTKADNIKVGSSIITPSISDFKKYSGQSRPSNPYGKIYIDKNE